jgi:hypothetical protein
VKLASSRRARHKLSNGVNDLSNRVTDQNIFVVNVLVNLAQSTGISIADINISTDDVNIHTVYVAHVEDETCIMMTW